MKKVLMLAPFFFDYEKRIKQNLEENGYKVVLYNDYSTYKEEFNFYEKFKMKILRQKKKILLERKEKYFAEILKKEERNSYDYVFIIKGAEIPVKTYQKLKELNKIAKWFSYQWDDLINCKEFLEKEHFFDKIYTFSSQDAEEYGYIHRPFFFTEDIELEKKTDICFVGTAHSDRSIVLKKILEKIKTYNLILDINLVIEKKKYIRKFLWLKKSFPFYKTKGISYSETMKKFAEANAIIEIPYITQKSITTRSIEALGLKSKVITTTEDIKNQDFYKLENYYVIDRDNPVIPLEWLKIKYKPLDKKIIEKYTLDSWREEIFGKQ